MTVDLATAPQPRNTRAETTLRIATWEKRHSRATLSRGRMEARAQPEALPEFKKPEGCGQETRGSCPRRAESHPLAFRLRHQSAGLQGSGPQPHVPCRTSGGQARGRFRMSLSLSAPGAVLRLLYASLGEVVI